MSSHRQRIAARRARVLQRAIVEPLEGRTLLSNPIVLDAMERELRDNFIAPTANSADLNFAPEPYEHEYTEPRLVYGFDQPVSGLDNQSHVLTSLYQVVLIENPAYPLQDVPFKVWTGPGGSTLSSLLLDSTDGVTWTGSDGGVTATLTEHEEFIWDHRLSVTTPTGSVTWKLSWNGYDSGGNIYPDSSSITGDGADYFIESLGGPQYSTSHTAGNVVAPPDISAPVFSPDGMTASFLFPNGPLPNGYYDSVLSSGGITNSSGEHLDGDLTLAGENDFIYSFFVLAGDANHDGVVNIDDYGVIDGNVGQSGSVFGFFNGDFNYDNLINVDDYGIIDSTYATQLPAPLTGANQLSASAAYQREDVDNFIRLQWIAPEGVSDIDSWGLWRSSDGGVTFTLLTNDIPGEARSFDDIGDGQGLPEGTKYTYRLRAFSNELGYSETTNKAWSVTNLPGPITATITDVTTTSMKLNWPDNAANEDGYEVWQERPDTYPLLIATLPANATSYTIAGLDPNTQYTFRVNAFTDATGSLPASATATTLDGPVEPTALTATLVGPTSLTLNWTDKSWNETGFEIESSTDGVNFALIATPGVNATTLPLSGLTPDTQYTFRIRAVGNASSPWMTLGVRTLPVGVPIKPSNATASTNAASSDSEWWKATLTWQDNSSDETGFTIQQLQSDGTWSTIATVGPDVETYTMNDLDAATDYTWRVLADGSGGSSGGGSGGLGGSAPANQGSATTPIAYGQIFDSEYEQWFLSGGIQRQWGGAAETYADGSLIRGTGDGAVTLTLSNLPKHGALVVSGDIGGSLSRITVNGTDVGHTPDSSNGPFWVAHTGETATIVLDPGPTPGMEYSTPWVKVEMDTPHLQVDGATVGVGDEVESHVYASDHGFMPMPAGVYSLPWPEELTLTPKFTPDGIMSIDGSVTIAAGAGEAIFTLHGEAAGSTQVVMAIAEKGAASAPAQQKVMQITNGTLRPRPTAITEQLQKLDAEEFTDRQAAQAQLEEWLRQYPELREDYLRERANLKDEGKGRVDEMLSKQTLVLRLEGNKLTFERGPGAGNPGEFLQGLAKITSGPRIGLKRPGGQIEQLRVISTTGLSGSTDLAPREVGDETITVEFTVTYRDANGEPVTRPYTSTIKLKVVDEAIQEG